MRLLFAIIIALTTFNCSKASAENFVVAFVNDIPVTKFDVDSRIRFLSIINKIEADKLSSQEVRSQIINQLIDEKLFKAKAEEAKIDITEQQIDSVIAGIERDNQLTSGFFKQELGSKHNLYEHYRQHLASQMQLQQLVHQEHGHKIQMPAPDSIENAFYLPDQALIYEFYTYSQNNPFSDRELSKISCNNPQSVSSYSKSFTMSLAEIPHQLKPLMLTVNINAAGVMPSDNTKALIVCDRSVNLHPDQHGYIQNQLLMQKMTAASDDFLKTLRQESAINFVQDKIN